MAWIGDMMMKGLAGGIDETADEVVDSAKSMTKDLDSVFENLGTDLSSVPTNFELKNVLDTTASVPQNQGLVLNTCFLAAKSIAELSSKITTIKNWLYTEPDKYFCYECLL